MRKKRNESTAVVIINEKDAMYSKYNLLFTLHCCTNFGTLNEEDFVYKPTLLVAPTRRRTLCANLLSVLCP